MIPFRDSAKRQVPENVMRQVFERLKTPYKYGAVLKLPQDLTDSASVFFHDGRWYLYYISISKNCDTSGYTTHIAVSSDLLHWREQGDLFQRDDSGRWDSKQIAGYAALTDLDLFGTNRILPFDGHYYVTYLAGNSNGYEPDPLYMGLARGTDPANGQSFRRFEQPILSPLDADARPDETRTLYKSFLFEDAARTTGHRFVIAYNAKSQDCTERIFLAVSDDLVHFERYGSGPVLDDITGHPGEQICGDPFIRKLGNLYIMVYFRYRYGGKAYDTFACSYDLVHWTRWQGPPLIQSEEPFEDLHAHKPWLVYANNTVYHFYTAVNHTNERFIALATSKPLR